MSDNSFKDVEDLRARTSRMRISMISLTTTIEHQIELILVEYFTINGDDYRLFCSLFYPMEIGLNFGIKIKIFEIFFKQSLS